MLGLAVSLLFVEKHDVGALAGLDEVVLRDNVSEGGGDGLHEMVMEVLPQTGRLDVWVHPGKWRLHCPTSPHRAGVSHSSRRCRTGEVLPMTVPFRQSGLRTTAKRPRGRRATAAR